MRNLRTFFASTCAAALLALPMWAGAEAPMQKVQSPGWYRMMVGNIEVTALSDGTVELPMEKLLKGIKIEQIRALLARSYRRPPVETSVNAFLVNTGSRLILIDAGAAGLFGPTLGNLMTNLKLAGYTPEQVDEVWITHMHPDHVGGLVIGGKRAYPNAIVRADANEASYWLSAERLGNAKAEDKAFFEGAIASIKPYIEAGKFVPFEGEKELMPGIKAMPAPGHTTGHTIYSIENDGYKLVVWGDLVHAAAVQFPLPAVTIDFDSDPRRAASERQTLMTDAANRGYFVALTHVQFPGLGQVKPGKDGQGFEWVPANYYAIP